MNIYMKNFNKKVMFTAVFATALFLAGFSHASAQVTFNNNPADLDTVKIMNVTQHPNSTTNWANSITANPGQTIAVRVYYHNTGNTTATNTLVNLGPQNTNLGHNFTFNGNVTSSNCTNCPQSGSAYVTIAGSQSQTLTYVPGSAIWYNTNPIGAGIPLNSSQVNQLFNGGFNIGNVLPDGTANGCPASQTWCHQGTVRAQFVVSNNIAPVACAINSFSASPSNNIPYNSSTNLSWTTTGANSVNISNINGTQNADGSVQTGALQNSTTFTLTANCINGSTITQNVYVSVANQPGCSVSNFTAYPTTVTSGGTSTLNWNTTGSVSNITVTGPGLGGGDIFYSNSGTFQVGPLTQNSTFTLTVHCANGQTIVRTVYITVTQPIVYQCSDNIDNDGDGKTDYPADLGCYGPTDNNEYNAITQTQNPVCTITSFSASQGYINYGASTNLLWTTTNCTNVSITSIGSVSPVSAGSHTTGALNQDTTYTITATNSNYNSTASPRQYTVRVGNSPTCYINSFSASPSTVAYNSPANLMWATSNCVSASITNIGSVVVNGSAPTGNLIMQTVYTLTAIGANGLDNTKNVTVYVSQQPQQGYCAINSFNANPSTVVSGNTTTLTWSTSNNCTDVSISGIGQVATSGSTQTNPINGYTTFTLSASVNGGAIQTRTINVNITNTPVPPPQPVFVCNDHIDNDGDGYTDYPFDPGCSNYNDQDEYNYVSPQIFACNDGLDNDGDGYRDLNDPGCTSFSDNDEYNYVYVAPQVYACNDHVDNDGDGYTDYPYDPGCSSYYDTNEYNYVAPVTNPVTYIYTGGGGSGVPLMTLKIETRFQTVSAGDTIDYTVTYKNIANRTTLKDVVVELQFPENVDFVQSTRGIYSTLDSRLTLDVGTLAPQAEESFFVQAKVNFKAKNGDVLSTSGTASYVTPSNTQGVVKAFAMNTVSNNGNSFLAGLALFGADGILPHTLAGWLLLLLVIFLIVMLGRRAFAPTPAPAYRMPSAPLPH